MTQTKLRWGLIGCGDIARKRVAPALSRASSSELIAVSRANPSLAEDFAREFGARRWYADWHELLRDEEVDAVYVATPVHLHAEQTISAAERGKHVLCEKPMALNEVECKRMVAACDANDVKLGVAYYRHFYPVVNRIKALLHSGEIGSVVVVHMNAFEWFNPEPGHAREWLLDPVKSGGGPMFDFGCHRIEVLLDLFGEVEGVTATLSNGGFHRKVEDLAIAQFAFATGAVAVLTVAHSVREKQDTLDIFGSGGSLHLAALNAGEVRVVSESGERVESHPPPANLHQPVIDDFAVAVLSGQTPAVDGTIGTRVNEILARIYNCGTLTSGA